MNSIEIQHWQRLYDLAEQVRILAPWEIMSEYDVFCIVPDEKTRCFISILGELGEHFAVSAYLGDSEYYKLMNNSDDLAENPEMFFEISQLQLSFEHSSFLQKEDKEIIKGLGLSFAGKKQAPMFRSFRDGFFPWFLEPDEVKMMITILEQSLDVLERIKKGSFSLDQADDRFLVRYPEKMDGRISWKEKTEEIRFIEEAITFQPDEKLVNKIKVLPQSGNLFDFDYSLLPNPIKDKVNERPYYSSVALLADRKSEMILGFELFGSKLNSNQRLIAAAAEFLKVLSKQPSRPKGVDISKPSLYQIMAPVMDKLGIKLRLVDAQPLIKEIRQMYSAHLQGNR